MHHDEVIRQLIEFACPSINYRIRNEILGQPSESPEMLALQELILGDPLVKEVIRWQQPDGWLAWDFHGRESIETGIRILCEKGLSHRHPILTRALQALEDHPERLDRGIGKPGKVLDELGFGGSRMIQATLGAYAGLEDKPFVSEQVTEALSGFRAVLEVDSVKEIVEEYQGRLVFKPGVRWPGIYHLRLLAFTRKWRTPEHQAMLVQVVRRLIGLSPVHDIYVRSKSQWIAPASFCMHEYDPDMVSMDAASWMMWFHRTECLARLGVVPSVSELKRQVETMETRFEAEGDWFIQRLNHPYFTKWGPYTGLMLEPGWRHPKNRVYDLTFRRLLILHYYES